jgi:hypothetical protein
MEALKETITAKEELRKFMHTQLLKRKMWYENCKMYVKNLDRDIEKDKRRMAKLSPVPPINLQTPK